MAIVFKSVQKVTFAEDRLREARYWATRSIAERLIAGWELADQPPLLQGPHEQQKRTGIVVRRVLRRPR